MATGNALGESLIKMAALTTSRQGTIYLFIYFFKLKCPNGFLLVIRRTTKIQSCLLGACNNKQSAFADLKDKRLFLCLSKQKWRICTSDKEAKFLGLKLM